MPLSRLSLPDISVGDSVKVTTETTHIEGTVCSITQTISETSYTIQSYTGEKHTIHANIAEITVNRTNTVTEIKTV